jgi:Cupredoxin-like domain
MFGSTLGLALLAGMSAVNANAARADEAVTVSIAIREHQFAPAAVHAPAGKPIAFAVKNLGSIASEFESGVLHTEKVIAPDGEAIVHVRPLAPAAIISSTISPPEAGYLAVQ